MNIVSIVVRARPRDLDAVERSLLAFPGTEVHAAAGDGRLIVTVEGNTRRAVADVMTRIHTLEGVLNASMVYEHSDTDPMQLETS